MPTSSRRSGGRSRAPRFGILPVAALAVLAASTVLIRSDFIDSGSFSVCEEATDSTGVPRPECRAGDIRFEIDPAGPVDPADSQFGFAVAAGDLNGDDFIDLAVGDPARNRVYIFFGRVSTADAYGLDPLDLADRQVSAETQADVILFRDPAAPNQVASFGFSLAIGREPVMMPSCGPNGTASPLLIGAPGHLGTAPSGPGTAFHIPAGNLCATPVDPPVPMTIDPASIGQSFVSPDAVPEDEFGYSVGFGRILATTGSGEDVIVGARNALGGAGRVTILPVNAGSVGLAPSGLVRIDGLAGDGLGEVLSSGDLDLDFDMVMNPFGGSDDLAAGAVGAANGKVVLAQGPLSPTGSTGNDGIYQEGVDAQIRAIDGEKPGDFFGFSVQISVEGHLAVGAIYADNTPPGAGGDSLTNVASGERVNGGKVYLWNPNLYGQLGPSGGATTASLVLVGRRSGDHLGFGLAFGDANDSGEVDLVATARREDGSGLTLDEIDQGTAYVILDVAFHSPALVSPLDLNNCAVSSDCTGVGNVDVMIFGGDRNNDQGDEMGFAAAFADFNGDAAADLVLSSLVQRRVYLVTLEDTDGDRLTEGRNVRDDDDDGDGDPDGTDCAPLDPDIHAGALEIPCDGIDQNCNGMEDDSPDADGDGYHACEPSGPADCDDNDPDSYPGAPELCDGNNNACGSSIPGSERDFDQDGWVVCTGWNDTQGDNPGIIGGGDCHDNSPSTYPGAAQIESGTLCMTDDDDDGWGDTFPVPGADPGTDCDDNDPVSFPGAPELCDGNDNACAGSIPADEITDDDGDRYVLCTGWNDIQGDDPLVRGGDDCDDASIFTFPGAAPLDNVPTACMKDADEDDYGDLLPPAWVTPGSDCDDDSVDAAATFPGAAPNDDPLTCLRDTDGDDWGDASVAPPIPAGSDCDDADPDAFPGGTEIPDDGIDQDCSGTDTVTCYIDQDFDGYGCETCPGFLQADGTCDTPQKEAYTRGDCEDLDPDINPDAVDIPDDGIDQDCNGADTVTCFIDSDQDGHGNLAGLTNLADDGACNTAQMESGTMDDCDDNDPDSHPGATELCDGNDNACAGMIPLDEADADGDGFVACTGWNDTQGDDPGIAGGGDCDDVSPTAADTYPGAAPLANVPTACMKDSDGDDYGDQNPPAGVTRGNDCDDGDVFTFPGAAEIEAPANCMRDLDDDGWGDSAAVLPVVAGTDCQDADPGINPGAAEVCDGTDNDCDGTIDNPDAVDAMTWYEDLDGDGFGNISVSQMSCTQPAGFLTDNTDCDDVSPTAADTYPGAAPLDNVPTACMKDSDGDDFGDDFGGSPPAGITAGTDCDDASPVTFTGAAETEAPGNCMRDADGDGWGDSGAVLPVVPGTDCDDADPGINPGAFDIPGNSIDEDCSGSVACFQDLDGDGYGCTCAISIDDLDADGACVSPGESAVNTDCNDGDPAINPGAAEIPGNAVDEDCSGGVTCFQDLDGDAFGSPIVIPDLDADGDCASPGESGVDTDCDDGAPAINPGAMEIPGNTVDEDCSGTVSCFQDLDGDTFGSTTVIVDLDADSNCVSAGESTVDTDCDDSDIAEFPGQSWYPDCDNDGSFAGLAVTACDVAGADAQTPCLDALPPDGGWSHTAGADPDDEDAGVSSGPPPAPQVLGVSVTTDAVSWLLGGGTSPSNVYRGDLETLRATGEYTQVPDSGAGSARFCGVQDTTLPDNFMPEPGRVVFYLVTAVTATGETDLGIDSNGVPRPNGNPCP